MSTSGKAPEPVDAEYQMVGESGALVPIRHLAHTAMWPVDFHSLVSRFFLYWISSVDVNSSSLLGATPDLETRHRSVCVHTLNGIMGGGRCLPMGFQ